MSWRAIRLFEPLLRYPTLLTAAILLVTSFANWEPIRPRNGNDPTGLDLLLETELAVAGVAFAHLVHRSCRRSLLEYLATFPLPRRDALGAPLACGSVALLLLSGFLLVHEHSGAAWLEYSLLAPLHERSQPEFAARPFDCWLNVVCLPQATFWMHALGVQIVGTRFAHNPSALPIATGTFATFLAFATIGFLPGAYQLPVTLCPWLPSLAWLPLALCARAATLRGLSATAIETTALGQET